MSEWLPFRKCGFWDVPLNFLVDFNGQTYLFDRPFSEDEEDYQNHYSVYLLPSMPADPPLTEWIHLPERAVCQLADVPVQSVRFDETKKRFIHSEVFKRLGPLPSDFVLRHELQAVAS